VATDWLFYWMTQPSGLALIGLAVVVPFILWRLLLGNVFAAVGFSPLAVAYACAAFGILVVNFTASHIEFSDRVSSGLLQESQRWSIVPGWTTYAAVLSLIYVLPLLAVVGVPLAALLLRMRRLTYASIAAAVVALWLVLAVVAWAFPINEWHRTHRLASLTGWLTELLPSIVLIAVPFFVGIYGASRSARRAET
jgi:hypothetical protein